MTPLRTNSPAVPATAPRALTAINFMHVAALLRREAAITLDAGKECLVETRLASIAVKHGLGSVDELIDRVRGSEPALTDLHLEIVDALTTNDTLFFRDVHPWDALRKHVIPRLPPGSGALILVSSVAGVFFASGSFPYGASKGGMHGLAMTLEERLAGTGIRINELCPGSVQTPLLERSIADASERLGSTAYRDEVASRWTSPEQVAEVLAFMASPAADILRGTVRTI